MPSREEFTGLDISNPFEHSGLSKEAISALLELDDKDALQTAVGGLMRILAKSMHPDSAGKEVPFYSEFITSSQEIRDRSNVEAEILAKDFVRKRGRKSPTRKESEPKLTQATEHDSFELIRDLAGTKSEYIGLTLSNRLWLQVNPIYEYAPMVMLQHERDTYSIRDVSFEPIESSIQDSETLAKKIGEELGDSLPWELLIRPRMDSHRFNITPKRIVSEDSSSGHIVVKLNSEQILLDGSGKLIDELAIPELPTEISKPGIYGLSIKTEKNEESGEIAIVERKVSTTRRTVSDPDTIDMRILGSVGSKFKENFNTLLRTFSEGDEPRLPDSRRQFVPTVKSISTPHKYGLKIPKNIERIIGEDFLPSVKPNRYIIVSADNEIYLFGRVDTIYDFIDK